MRIRLAPISMTVTLADLEQAEQLYR